MLDDVEQKTCAGCHMPRVRSSDPAAKNGRVASHFFPGGHTWLQAMRGDAERLAEVEQMLVGAARLDIAAVTVGEQRALLPELELALAGDQPVVLDVVVENLRVGHHFPGGVRDVQDTWLDVRVASEDDQWVATSGAEHERRQERDAHKLRAAILDGSGAEVSAHATHQFQSVAFDHTLGAAKRWRRSGVSTKPWRHSKWPRALRLGMMESGRKRSRGETPWKVDVLLPCFAAAASHVHS
ncbi:MAG TPA: hypothetical protein PKD61_24605 [Polyangiaceae bacterium]|nr:hypothetical protein [Polyangiaceae bacterium]